MRKPPVTVGIDVGAISTEAVALRAGSILATAIAPTGADGKKAAAGCFRAALETAGIARGGVRAVASTGYGRKAVSFADTTVTEITSHARGAIHLFPRTESVIDIGGQDTKVIILEGNSVGDFVMNDRCAAGTGRFIEVMARTLQIPLERMGDESMAARRAAGGRLRISGTCTVFAESEVVSLLAKGTSKGRIILALHEAIADRVLAMTPGYRLGERITLSGGVAKNAGVVDCLRRRLNVTLDVPDEPRIVGALGAALVARNRLNA